MKEIKLRLYSHMNDSYNELYKVLNGDTKVKYFARHCWNDSGTWYFVADPHGYCELDHSCPEDYIFIVCGHNGKTLFKDSNGEISNPFPTLERKAKIVWNSIKDRFSTIDGLNDWLLSYLTREVIETTLKGQYCPYENWVAFWYDETGREVIEQFEHLGEKYCIYKINRKHRYCDCEWIEYFAGPETMDEYTNWIAYYGAYFDENKVGTCYSPNEARRVVMSALE
jgi:hypothetical protein